MDNFKAFQGIVNTFGGFGKVEKGWQTLISFAEKYKTGTSISYLDFNKTGFPELLDIIIIHRPEYDNKEVVAIINSISMSYSIGEGKVDYNMISLRLAGKNVPNVVATQEVVREWITEARSSWVLFNGFVVLFFGFVFGLASQFYRLKLEKSS
jgi:hypothetical protein